MATAVAAAAASDNAAAAATNPDAPNQAINTAAIPTSSRPRFEADGVGFVQPMFTTGMAYSQVITRHFKSIQRALGPECPVFLKTRFRVAFVCRCKLHLLIQSTCNASGVCLSKLIYLRMFFGKDAHFTCQLHYLRTSVYRNMREEAQLYADKGTQSAANSGKGSLNTLRQRTFLRRQRHHQLLQQQNSEEPAVSFAEATDGFASQEDCGEFSCEVSKDGEEGIQGFHLSVVRCSPTNY